MDELISRNALIAEYDRVHVGAPGGARKLMQDAPAVNRWIPVEDALPEENNVVLVSTTTGHVDFAVLRWGKWFSDGYVGVPFPPNRITAWMPKPAAYEPPAADKGERIIL